MDNKNIYESPIVEVFEVEAEKGFASSQVESVDPDGDIY